MSAALGSLRRFAMATLERCDACGAALLSEHAHVLDQGAVRCACERCARGADAGAGGASLIPSRLEALPDDAVPEPVWDALDVPIGLCWLLGPTSARGPLAEWPSPGGPVRAPIAAETWARACETSPALAALRPDVEAVLLHRLRGAREQWLVSIDRCLALSGVVRCSWRGLSGGPDLAQAIATALDELRAGAGAPRAEGEGAAWSR